MTYRAALIGCGMIGSQISDEPRAAGRGIATHAEAYAACPQTELVAVCDADMNRAQRCAQRWKVAASYADPLQLLAEQKPDIVSVCTPDDTHFDIVRAALCSAGVRAVLAEKPLALRLAEAEGLVALARRRAVVLAVNYSRRYADNHVRLRDLIRSGGLGAVGRVRGLYTRGTLHNGTHWFDIVRFLLGEVRQVHAVDRLHEGGPDGTLDVSLLCEGGALAELAGVSARDFTVFEMDVLGTRGRVLVTDVGNVMEFLEVVEDLPLRGYRSLQARDRTTAGLRDCLLHAVEDLVHCLQTGSEPRCTGEDGLEALRIGFAAQASSARGAPVALGGG
jgi:predicted dehydrogenase